MHHHNGITSQLCNTTVKMVREQKIFYRYSTNKIAGVYFGHCRGINVQNHYLVGLASRATHTNGNLIHSNVERCVEFCSARQSSSSQWRNKQANTAE